VILAFMLWFAATAPPTTMSSSAAFAQYHPGPSDRSTFNETFDTCTGESVQIQGTLHSVVLTTVDANGVEHITIHSNLQGRGESDSGAKYVLHDTYNLHVNSSATPPYTFNLIISETLIRQGSATPEDDLLLHVFIHQTLNAQGELTSEVSKAEIVCK
jgi:hypothetical protein